MRTVTSGLNCILRMLRSMLGRVVEEVEAADLVRAVVRAVPRADAAVVGHVVQAFGAVRGRADRADLLARRVLAVLAGIGCVTRCGSFVVTHEVAVDAEPVHLARVLRTPSLPTIGNVVLGLAGDHAGVAAGAGVQVDAHAPLVALRRCGLCTRLRRGGFFDQLLGELGLLRGTRRTCLRGRGGGPPCRSAPGSARAWPCGRLCHRDSAARRDRTARSSGAGTRRRRRPWPRVRCRALGRP